MEGPETRSLKQRMCLGVLEFKKKKKKPKKPPKKNPNQNQPGGIQHGKKNTEWKILGRVVRVWLCYKQHKTSSLKGKRQATMMTWMPKNSTNYGLRLWRC